MRRAHVSKHGSGIISGTDVKRAIGVADTPALARAYVLDLRSARIRPSI